METAKEGQEEAGPWNALKSMVVMVALCVYTTAYIVNG